MEDLLKALDMTTEGDMVQQAQRQLLLAYSDFAVHCSMQGAYQDGVLPLSKALRTSSRRKASTSTAEVSGVQAGAGGPLASALSRPLRGRGRKERGNM